MNLLQQAMRLWHYPKHYLLWVGVDGWYLLELVTNSNRQHQLFAHGDWLAQDGGVFNQLLKLLPTTLTKEQGQSADNKWANALLQGTSINSGKPLTTKAA